MKLQDIKLTPLLDTLYLEDISDEEYFSKKFSNYISNSRLSLINPEQEDTPDKFFNSKFNNFSVSASVILEKQILLHKDGYSKS